MSIETKEYVHPLGRRRIRLNHFSACNTCNVRYIYMGQCGCPRVYVGLNTQPLPVWILEHHSRICHRVLELSLVDHYLEKGHSCGDLKYCVIYQYKPHVYDSSNMQKMLQHRESYWIFRVGLVALEGLNLALHLSFFI